MLSAANTWLFSAPKVRYNLAQGVSPGMRPYKDTSPEGATLIVSPLRGFDRDDGVTQG